MQCKKILISPSTCDQFCQIALKLHIPSVRCDRSDHLETFWISFPWSSAVFLICVEQGCRADLEWRHPKLRFMKKWLGRTGRCQRVLWQKPSCLCYQSSSAMGIATSGLPLGFRSRLWGIRASSCNDELWGMGDAAVSRDRGAPSPAVPAGWSGVCPQPELQMAKGEGLAVPFSWQTLFSWSCRVPVSVGEDLAPCHSRSWYMGILPSFLSALPSLDIPCVGGGKRRRGGAWGKCEKWVKLSESLRYSPRLIPPVGKGVDFWIAACVVRVYYFYAGSNWNT